ncbi:MAG: hypothetical protein AAGG81_06045 [Chlamydiota bacterium]
MNLIEFIGFIITMILVIYLSSKRAIEDRKRRLDPNYDEGEEDDNFREMVHLLNLSPEDVKALERELKGEPAQPPPPPNVMQQKTKTAAKKRVTRTLSDQYALRTNIENFKQRSKVAEREFDTKIDHRYEKPRKPIITQSLRVEPERDPYATIGLGSKKTRIKQILDSLESKNNMIILHEIIDKPKALKDDKIHW